MLRGRQVARLPGDRRVDLLKRADGRLPALHRGMNVRLVMIEHHQKERGVGFGLKTGDGVSITKLKGFVQVVDYGVQSYLVVLRKLFRIELLGVAVRFHELKQPILDAAGSPVGRPRRRIIRAGGNTTVVRVGCLRFPRNLSCFQCAEADEEIDANGVDAML